MQILLLGIETHVCVFQTAVDLIEEGYEVHLVVDGVSSKRPTDRATAIQVQMADDLKLLHTNMIQFKRTEFMNTCHFLPGLFKRFAI